MGHPLKLAADGFAMRVGIFTRNALCAFARPKGPEHFRMSPGGYFQGMLQKAKARELHLERTVWALRRGRTAI